MAPRLRLRDGRTGRLAVSAVLLLALTVVTSAEPGGAGAAVGEGTEAVAAKAAGSLQKKVRKLGKKVKKTSKRLAKLEKRVDALESGTTAVQRANYAAPAFTPVDESTNNNNGESVCGAFVPSEKGAENMGDLNAKTGSFLAQVVLPDGATIDRLAMFANDFSDQDAHVFLVRKRIENGLDPQFDGYEVLAQVSTSGAENGVMREFAAPVSGGLVDNGTHYLFLELVVCDAIEPFAIQVSYAGG